MEKKKKRTEIEVRIIRPSGFVTDVTLDVESEWVILNASDFSLGVHSSNLSRHAACFDREFS